MNGNPDDSLNRPLDAWAVAAASAKISFGLERRVTQELASSLTPVRPIPSSARLTGIFFLILAACAAALTPIIGTTGLRLMSVSQIAAISAILAAAALLFSVALTKQMIPGSRRVLSISSLLALTALGIAAAIALLFPWTAPRAFVREGWPCSAMETAIAVPGALLFWLLARRGALFPGGSTGATIAGLAAILALVVLQFQCMFQQAPHLLVWHAGVAAILIALGAVLGQ